MRQADHIAPGLETVGLSGGAQRMACDPCIILFYLGYGMIGGRLDGSLHGSKLKIEHRLYNG